MHRVGEEGEVLELDNVTITLKSGAIRARDEYYVMLDALSNCRMAPGPVQFTSNAGLGRAAVVGAGLGGAFVAHLFWAVAHAQGALTGAGGAWSAAVLMWSLYGMALCWYHMSEFLLTMRFNAPIAACDSFLLTQSKEYQIAMVASWIEFWLETWLVPGLKGSLLSRVMMVVGLFLVVMGQFFRSGAMVSAQSNFTHLIQTEKSSSHRLVTDGLYRYLRHPSYFGWFWWSVGTQILVCNPICFVGYVAAAWKFFSVRVKYEEFTLVQFFPDEYPRYRERTPVGIPFIQ